MRFGEANRKEEVVFLVAGVVRICFCFLVAYKSGGGTAVVSVGNVEVWDFSKFLGDLASDFIVVDNPESVSEAIGCNEVVFGSSGSDFLDNFLEGGIFGESE